MSRYERFELAKIELRPIAERGHDFRPWKTLLVRTVADGGMSYYFRGDHRVTIPTLWQRLGNWRKDEG